MHFYEADEEIKWKCKDYNMLLLEVGYKEEDRRIVLEFLQCPDTDAVFSTDIYCVNNLSFVRWVLLLL